MDLDPRRCGFFRGRPRNWNGQLWHKPLRATAPIVDPPVLLSVLVAADRLISDYRRRSMRELHWPESLCSMETAPSASARGLERAHRPLAYSSLSNPEVHW